MERSLIDWLALGGPVMGLLGACSVLVVAVVLERLFALRRSATVPQRVAEDRLERSSLGRVVLAGQKALDTHARQGPDAAIERAGAIEVGHLGRHMPLLAALGNLATMLGLLGTVLGMIAAFDRIAEAGTGDARIVATGIFEALVTTAAGLAIGIAALSAHAFLRRRVDALSLELEERVGEIFHLEDPIADRAPPELASAGLASQES